METVVRNGTVVSAGETYKADIAIMSGKIARSGKDLERNKVIDAAGHYIFPGGVDVHTHMQLPVGGTVSSDHFVTGTVAAASGGTTTIIDFADQERGRSGGGG